MLTGVCQAMVCRHDADKVYVKVVCLKEMRIKMERMFSGPAWVSSSISFLNDVGVTLLNRQLAKLLSGNEVRGKVAIAAICRRLSISLVRYRHGLEKFLEHHFIPIRRRFNPRYLPTDLLRVQGPIFFRGRKPIFSTGNVDGVAWLVLVRSFIAYLKLWASF